MLCPANLLGVMCAIRLARTGASCGVRRLAAAVCRPGLPGRAATAPHKSRTWFGAQLLRAGHPPLLSLPLQMPKTARSP
ncbi:MAG TPA: hypothetical protein VGR97_14560 [Candidatus Acidoferrales bacterium]|nr:hypothetical protein [Candidatus Acidoferrales bacterium]